MADGLVDLHRHLDGSLRARTLEELARPLGVVVPADLTFRGGMGLEAALERFAITLAVLQTPAAVRRVAAEMCEDAAQEGLTTLEIRFAPQLHRGASLEEIADAAIEGAAGRAGIILCALYGEDPAVAEALVTVAASRPGIVGIDLAGGPAPDHRYRMEDYAPAFERARDLGLGRTVHAGEGRPPEEIRTAIERLFAQRIGHGTTLLDDPSVADLVIERGVTIEACPTSNVHTGCIAAIADHPIASWLARGVRVTVCADNTLLSATNAAEELRRLAAAGVLDEARIAKTVEHGRRAAFRR